MTETLTLAVPATRVRPKLDFDELYRANREDVYAYVATLVGDRSLAEEVTAAAFERAYRRRASFDARRGGGRPWLFRIARNVALDELRKRRRTATLVDEPAADAPDPQERVEDALRWAAVRKALDGLEPREREVIALKFFAGFSNSELARVLRVSETNAGTLVHRAVTRLRRECDEAL